MNMTMNKESEISELLALRDGEPYDATLVEAGSGDEQMRTLQQLAALKAELRGMPDVPLEESVWRNVRPSPAKPAVSRWLRYPLATAASVFFLSAVAIYTLLGPGVDPASDAPVEYATDVQVSGDGVRLAALMNQSRDLERILTGDPGWRVNRADSTGSASADGQESALAEMLAYRIADVDAQIAGLHEDGAPIDPALRADLWSQRVMLLEAYVGELSRTNPGVIDTGRSL